MLAPFPSPYSAALLRMHLLGNSSPSPQPHPQQKCVVFGAGIGRAQSRKTPVFRPTLFSLLRLPAFPTFSWISTNLTSGIQVTSRILPGYSFIYKNSSPSYHYRLPIPVVFLLHPKPLSLARYCMTSSSRSCSSWCWNGGWAGEIWLSYFGIPLTRSLVAVLPKANSYEGGLRSQNRTWHFPSAEPVEKELAFYPWLAAVERNRTPDLVVGKTWLVSLVPLEVTALQGTFSWQ